MKQKVAVNYYIFVTSYHILQFDEGDNLKTNNKKCNTILTICSSTTRCHKILKQFWPYNVPNATSD